MAVKVEFKTNNAAFEDPSEVSRILREVADRIDDGVVSNRIMDYNGNKIGKYSVKR